MKTMLLALPLLAALGAPAGAERSDDDLAAVKKAVGRTTTQAQAKPADESADARRPAVEEEPAAPLPRARGAEPKWFRVRIVEKGGKRGRVSVNLPLGLVRAIGGNWPLHACERCEHGRGATIGEVLRTLDSGQNLVEIDDEEATVRVWVE